MDLGDSRDGECGNISRLYIFVYSCISNYLTPRWNVFLTQIPSSKSEWTPSNVTRERNLIAQGYSIPSTHTKVSLIPVSDNIQLLMMSADKFCCYCLPFLAGSDANYDKFLYFRCSILTYAFKYEYNIVSLRFLQCTITFPPRFPQIKRNASSLRPDQSYPGNWSFVFNENSLFKYI